MVNILCSYCQYSHSSTGRICCFSEPHPRKALPLPWDWSIGRLAWPCSSQEHTFTPIIIYFLCTWMFSVTMFGETLYFHSVKLMVETNDRDHKLLASWSSGCSESMPSQRGVIGHTSHPCTGKVKKASALSFQSPCWWGHRCIRTKVTIPTKEMLCPY